MSHKSIIEALSNEGKGQERTVELSADSVGTQLNDTAACELELLRIEVRQREEGLKNISQDREQRKDFALRIFRLLSIYLVVVAVIILLGSIDCLGITISDSVLITILGTTTANVLAIFRFVARYLYK